MRDDVFTALQAFLNDQGDCGALNSFPAGNLFNDLGTVPDIFINTVKTCPPALFEYVYDGTTPVQQIPDIVIPPACVDVFACFSAPSQEKYCKDLKLPALLNEQQILQMLEASEDSAEIFSLKMDLIEILLREGRTDEGIEILLSLNTEQTTKLSAGILISLNRFTEAKTIVDGFSPSDEENLNFKKYYGILCDLGLSGKEVMEMDSVQIQAVREVSSSSTNISIQAKALLDFLFGEEFTLDFPALFGWDQETFRAGKLDPESKRPEPFISGNYPNPFNVNTTIQYVLPEDEMTACVEIFDLLGRMMMKIKLRPEEKEIALRAEDFPDGMYLYRLLINNKITGEHRKMFVVK